MASNFWSSSHCNHWLLPPLSLLSTRHLDHTYITPRQLSTLHIFFANLIYKLGKRLSLRQIPIATACVFFKRFYLKASFVETDPFLVAAACVYVAAKVEETPVHIKSVVSESRQCYNDYNVKSFPNDYTKLAEMEFYLLSDLDFHLLVYHPYRTLSVLCGREPADSGTFTDPTPVPAEEEGEGEEEEDEMGLFGERAEKRLKEEEEEERVARMCGRGTGRGVGYVEDPVLQMAWFVVNDTYRTDIPLTYPPYIIALASLYLAFMVTEKNPQPSLTPTSTTPTTTPANPLSSSTTARLRPTNPALPTSTPASPTGTHSPSPSIPQSLAAASGRRIIGRAQAPEFFADLQVSLPTILAVVQEIIAIYPIWEELDYQAPSAGGQGRMSGSMGLSAVGQVKAQGGGQGLTLQNIPASQGGEGGEGRGLREMEVVGFLVRVRGERALDLVGAVEGGS